MPFFSLSLSPSKANHTSSLNGMTQRLGSAVSWPAPIYHEDSKILPSSDVCLLQQVDDLLFAVRDGEICLTGTELLEWYLGDIGCHTSVKKVQTRKQQVMYLGSTLKRGQLCLSDTWKETVIKIKTPTIARKVKVLSIVSFRHLWIPTLMNWWNPGIRQPRKGKAFYWQNIISKLFTKSKPSLGPSVGPARFDKAF